MQRDSKSSTGMWPLSTVAQPLLGKAARLRSSARERLHGQDFFVAANALVGAAVLLCTAHLCAVPSPAPASGGLVSGIFLKRVSIPVGALLSGLAMLFVKDPRAKTVSTLLIYFGSQTGMHLYMKTVLSRATVSVENDLRGLPAAFLVTSLQQITAFVIFGLFLVISWFTPWAYVPKKLAKKDWVTVACFSLTFALNTGLNNFGLSLLPISVHLTIRSCMPLSSALSSMLTGWVTGQASGTSLNRKELMIMLAGVFCAALVTVARAQGSAQSGGGKLNTLIFGVFVAILSIFSGGINFALAAFLGSSVKLNPLDTTCYMAVPAAFFLMFPLFLMPHPVHWPGYDMVTDFKVLQVVLEERPKLLWLASLSGVFAFIYNAFQYSLVQSLSPTYTSSAGNFNKAAVIVLGLLLGLEHLPDGGWGVVAGLAIAGNIAAFTLYSMVKTSDKSK